MIFQTCYKYQLLVLADWNTAHLATFANSHHSVIVEAIKLLLKDYPKNLNHEMIIDKMYQNIILRD